MQHKILIIEDDLTVSELLDQFLMNNGFTTAFASDGYEGLLQFEKEHPSLVLLGLMLPKLDGIQTCREIRKISNVPIIFMSFNKDSRDIVEGLNAGGDDYVTKPLKLDELLARIHSNLRRAPIYHQANLQPTFQSLQATFLQFDELIIDKKKKKVYLQDEEINLSSKEYRLLQFLAQNPNKIWSASDLYLQIWGNSSVGDTRTINVHISNLRKKIEQDVSNPKYILTVRGSGFMFNGK